MSKAASKVETAWAVNNTRYQNYEADRIGGPYRINQLVPLVAPDLFTAIDLLPPLLLGPKRAVVRPCRRRSPRPIASSPRKL